MISGTTRRERNWWTTRTPWTSSKLLTFIFRNILQTALILSAFSMIISLFIINSLNSCLLCYASEFHIKTQTLSYLVVLKIIWRRRNFFFYDQLFSCYLCFAVHLFWKWYPFWALYIKFKVKKKLENCFSLNLWQIVCVLQGSGGARGNNGRDGEQGPPGPPGPSVSKHYLSTVNFVNHQNTQVWGELQFL